MTRMSILAALCAASIFLSAPALRSSQTNAPAPAPPTPAPAPSGAVRERPLPPSGQHPRSAALMKRRWGIEVYGIHRVSGGYMLEFRFKVLDAKRSATLFDRKIKPYLLDGRTGAKVAVPSPEKVGELRNVNPPEAGKVYWMLFANPGKLIQPGSRVTVVAGEFRAEDLVVDAERGIRTEKGTS